MAKTDSTLTVGRLVDSFLAATKLSSAPGTYNWYAGYLTTFRAYVGDDKLVSELTGGLVHRWIAERYVGRSPSSHNSAARCITRAINWAYDERLIDDKPLRGFVKPTPGRREKHITPAEYAACLKALERSQRAHLNQPFRDVIKFLWHSGCRPQEIKIIEAAWVNGRKIVIPKHLSKGKIKSRNLYLDAMASRIVGRLAKQWPTGPLFRDSRGNAWKKSGINMLFRRLKQRTGIEGLCAYSFRHGFVTRQLEAGVDVATVAALAGHQPRMTMAVYNHVGKNEERLINVLDGAA